MPARYRRSPYVARRSRRPTAWATTNQTFTLAAGAHTTIDLGAALEVAGSSLIGVTIVRTRARFVVNNYSALTDETLYGFIVCRDTDIGAGNGPNPNSDPGLDWMLWDAQFPTGSGTTADEVRETVIDLKSQRKMRQLTQRYGLAVVNTAGASKNYAVTARVLFKLP